MKKLRKFKCLDCNQVWKLPFDFGGIGLEQTCPKCQGHNVRRVDKEFDSYMPGARKPGSILWFPPLKRGRWGFGWTSPDRDHLTEDL